MLSRYSRAEDALVPVSRYTVMLSSTCPASSSQAPLLIAGASAELEVVRLAGESLRNDAIARRLFIAPGTVKVPTVPHLRQARHHHPRRTSRTGHRKGPDRQMI